MIRPAPTAAPLSAASGLDDVRAVIAEIAATLDPASRYVPELLAVVDASRDTPDLLARLAAGSRGARHAGSAVFARMTVEQKIRCNLITNETVLFRFSEGEWDVMRKQLERFASRGAEGGRILCAPCSHGEEAFSIAAECLKAGVPFSLEACDIQPECIAEAARGRLTMGFPEAWLETPAIVSPAVLDRIHFAVADLFLAPGAPGGVPQGPYDLVVCRNFLGYFREPLAIGIAASLARLVAPGGALFLDSFCAGKFPGLGAALAPLRRRGASPVFDA